MVLAHYPVGDRMSGALAMVNLVRDGRSKRRSPGASVARSARYAAASGASTWGVFGLSVVRVATPRADRGCPRRALSWSIYGRGRGSPIGRSCVAWGSARRPCVICCVAWGGRSDRLSSSPWVAPVRISSVLVNFSSRGALRLPRGRSRLSRRMRTQTHLLQFGVF